MDRSVADHAVAAFHSFDTGIVERARIVAFIAGCAVLFWQYDGAAVDWLFGLGIALSLLLVVRRKGGLHIAWPQPLVLVFLAVTVAATVLARGSPVALAITMYLVLASLSFASMLAGSARRARLVEVAIIAAAAVTVVVVALGWLARHYGWESLFWLTYDDFRSRGLFKDPNVAGGFLACSYPLAAAFVIRRGRAALPLLLIVTAATAVGVALSFSRMALVVFALGVVGVAVALPLLRRWRLFLGFIVSTLLAGLVVGGVMLRIGLDEFPLWRYQIQAYDEAGRFIVWGFAGEMFRDAPLGTGAGSFEPRALLYFNAELQRSNPGTGPAQRITVTPSAHNTYLRVLVESGVVGFLAFMSFLAVLLIRGLRAMSASSWEWPLAFALTLVAGLAIDTLHWRELWLFAAVISGAMLVQQAVPVLRSHAPGTPTPAPGNVEEPATVESGAT